MRTSTVTPLNSSDQRVIRDTAAQDRLIDPTLQLRRRKRLIIVVATLILGAVGGAVVLMQSWSSTTAVVPRERVRIATVERGRFVRDVAAQGTVIAAVSPTLYASANGKVNLRVKAGESVKKNQILASIDSPELNNELQREQATFDALSTALERQSIEVRRQQLQDQQTSDLAGVQITAAEREVERCATAWRLQVIPEYQYKRAQDELTTARLNYRHAVDNAKLQEESLNFELKSKRSERDRQRLVVENLKRRVTDLQVRSPVDGMVGSLAASQDSAVAQDSPLLSVVDLSAFEVEFRVPESYADALAIGMPAEVAYLGKTYTGTIATISPEVQQNEVAGRVRFAKEVPPGIRQNQRVNVRIVMDSREDVLKVERGNFTDAGSWIYVVSDATATRRAIQMGAMSVKEVEILSGLNPGEQVIVNNPTDLNDATTVRLSD